MEKNNAENVCERRVFFKPGTLASIIFISVGLLIATVLTVQAAPLSLEQLISRMQVAYDRTSDLKAWFIQDVTIKSVKKTEHEEGTVYFKNPKRMHWSYEKPKAKKLIINPQKAWLYMPDDHAVYIQDAGKMYKSRLAVRFLSGIGKLKADFKISFSQPSTDANGHYLLTLAPKASDVGVDKLYLTVDKDSMQIIECHFADMYGNTTRIQFKNMKINTGIPEQMFTFKPPAGVEIMKLP
jgi:outer membrane lipoprotein carrier protein